ncbi:MAG: SNF2 helicase associated domain-containing protein, partial [Bacilli bacterium]|nr:SNF2 helicase associated domain-containing protein [Bacilli bacterium]
MLSLFLKKEEISRYTGRLSAAQRREYRLHFEEESVHVYFKFDADRISYIAYCEDKYGEFSVSVAGKLQIVSTDLSYALLEYVRELDESGNEAVLRRMYGNQYEALSLFLRLGPKKAKALLNASTRVDELASRIEGEKKMEELPQANIRFAVTSKSNEFEVYLKVGFDKLYVTHRVGAFIRDYFSGNAMNIQKRFVTLPKNSFSPSVESGLQFLYNQLLRNYYYNASYDVTLSSNLMVAFLFLLVGERVDFDGKTLLVDKPISVSLRIDEFGELLTEPPVSREGMCQAGKQAFSIEGNHICLYEFASAGAGELFGFFDTLRGIDTSFVADQLAKKVLPLLSDEEVKIDDGFARVHPVLRPRIEYYIGLEDEKRLSFRTKYFLGLSEVTGDEFEDALASAKAKRASFLAELQSLGFPENGEEESDDAIVSYLKTDLSLLASLCQIFISEELKKKRLLTTPNFELHTNSGEDWFEVTLYSDDYDPQELLQIYHAFVRKKKFVKFHGNYVVIEEDDPRLQRLAESFTPDEIGVELPLYQALKVPFAADETDAKVLDLLEKVENYEVIDTAGIPQQILDAMRPYQHMGIRFLTNLYRLGLSGVLSDDMGLGKTLQSFGLLSLVQEEKPILVVCPKSLIYNWLAERDKWYPDLPAFLLVGGPSERKKIYSRMSNGGKACYFV